jgi:predicted dehydrogenase
MATATGIRVAVVGLNFGRAFVTIYRQHPDVAEVVICDLDAHALQRVGDECEIGRRFTALEQVLELREIDAVHLVTPVPFHPEQTIAVLEAGKHCACAVPMATSLEDIHAVLAAQRRTQKIYMMMETAVYTRKFLFVKDLVDRGEFGTLTFLQGAHYQDMEGWRTYWNGLPPMYYATHAVAPLLALAGTRAVSVTCLGSGRLRGDLERQHGNPYPMETALFQLAETPIVAEVTRSLFNNARAFSESFNVYAEKLTIEWPQVEEEDPVLFSMGPAQPGRSRSVTATRVTVPARPDLLPLALAQFTSGGHGGSHPHLVHEFVRSIVEERAPAVDALTAANWTAAGICAHASAMADGATVRIPSFA